MRRFVAMSSAILLVGISLGAVVAVTQAQDDEETTAGHPLVGTWIADTDLDDASNPPETFIFSVDGGYIAAEAEGTSLGTWEATGASTAILTISDSEVDEEGNALQVVIRASIEVGADGNTFTADYTLEVIGPEFSSGEAGPAAATGTRLVAEAPGTPVLTLEELFGTFEGTPEATPSS
jgi:hypothetical protein